MSETLTINNNSMKICNIFISMMFLSLIFVSCQKTPVDLPNPSQPADTTTQRNFRLVFESLPNYTNIPQNLTAVITIENENTGSSLSISTNLIYDQQYHTAVMNLPKGRYKIEGLLIKDQNGTVRFATPVAGSQKAPLVNKPLSITMKLDDKMESIITMQVLQVAESDLPQSFGYEEGRFGNRNDNPNQERDRQILVRPIIRVGDVVYDSVPAQLIVKSWDAQNHMTYNIVYLNAGVQSVLLLAKAVKHQLSISKWGAYDALTLNKEDIEEGVIYDIGGDVAAQKLTTVYEYKIVNGVSTPITKTDFEYDADGRLKQKQVLAKHADMSSYLLQKDIYEYTNNKISTIKSYDEHNLLQKTTTAQYTRTRVIAMEEISAGEHLKITANYTPLETRSGLTQDYRIDAEYNSGPGIPVRYYNKTIGGGMALSDSVSYQPWQPRRRHLWI